MGNAPYYGKCTHLGIGRINYQFVANSGRFGIWKLVGIQGAILFPILAYGSNYGLCRDIYCAIFFVVIFTAKGTAGSMSGSSRCRLTRPNVGDPLPSLHGHYTRFITVGSEEARSIALALASVRRSNWACSFPAPSFHEDAAR